MHPTNKINQEERTNVTDCETGSIEFIGGNIMQAIYTSTEYWNRALRYSQLLLNAMKVRVRFTKDGWRQLSQSKSIQGSMFFRAVTIKNELALYIAAHEQRAIHFDTESQEIRYQNGITLIIRKEQGIWFITDVISTAEVSFEPVFFWTRLKQGCSFILAHVLIGWRKLRAQVQRGIT